MQCPVCHDVFNSTDRRPKLLHDCGHTLCKRCLEAVIMHKEYDNWSCPSCRSLYDLTSTEEFFDNFIIFDLVHKEKTKIWCRDCDQDLGDKCADHDVSTYKKFRAEELKTAEQQLRSEMRAGEQLQEAIDDFKQSVEDVLTPINVRARELMDAQDNDLSLLAEQCSSVADIRLVRQRSSVRVAKLDDERQTWDIIVRSKFGCSSIFWGVQHATEHQPETVSSSRDVQGIIAEAENLHQEREPATQEPEGALTEAGLLDWNTPQERQEMEVVQAEGPHQEREPAAEEPEGALSDAGLLDWNQSQEGVSLQSEADLLEGEPREIALERLQMDSQEVSDSVDHVTLSASEVEQAIW